MTTNIQTKLSELQERNREKINYELLINADRLNPETIDEITTDNFKAVALAVIGEIKKELGEEVTVFPGAEHYMTERELADEKQRIFGMNYRRNTILTHLTTLEATLKDPTPSTDVIRE